MTEKNREILSRAMNDLPNRKAGDSNWNDISKQLDNADINSFVQSHKNALPEYKAPATAWDGIAKSLPSPFMSFLSSGTGIAMVSIISLVTIIGLSWLLSGNPKTDETVETTTLQAIETTPSTVIYEEENTSNDAINRVENNQTAQEKTETGLVKSDQMNATKDDSKSVAVNRNDAINHNDDINRNDAIHRVDAKTQNSKLKTSGEPFPNDVAILPVVKTSKSGSLLAIPFLERMLDKKESSNILQGNFLRELYSGSNEFLKEQLSHHIYIGVHFKYQHILDLDYEGMTIPKQVYGLGLDLVYTKQNWFVKTGLTYQRWEEKADLFIDYNQNQLVYSYNYVDSAFVNPESGHVTYYTSAIDIYDSIHLQNTDQIKQQYKVLQIPVLLGYKLINNESFNIAVMGGIGFDIRLSGKQYIPVFNEKGASITQVQHNLMYRANNNWRLIGAIQADFKLSKKWSLYFEPSIQRYMNPLYEQNGNQSVNLFSIKTGILYSF